MSKIVAEVTEGFQFRDAERAHTSLLAPLEKKCLVWLANRLPVWVNSDHLTALGFFAMLMVGVSTWFARVNRAGLRLAIFWLAANWFGDSVDGTLARARNQQRK